MPERTIVPTTLPRYLTIGGIERSIDDCSEIELRGTIKGLVDQRDYLLQTIRALEAYIQLGMPKLAAVAK